MKAICILFLLGAASASAPDSGALLGLITNSSGEAVRNARIVLVDLHAGTKRETTTNELGIYAFSPLPAGEFRLEATKAGLAPLRVEKILLSTGERRSLRLRWKPSQMDGSIGTVSQSKFGIPFQA